MGRPCCCCSVGPLCTAPIGQRTPANPLAPDPFAHGFNELVWKLSEDTDFTTEDFLLGCSTSNELVGTVAGDPASVPLGFDVTVNDPDDLWYALKIFWPSDAPRFNQLGWLHEVTDQACYARPEVGLQYRYAAGGDFDSETLDRSPQVCVGFVVRDDSDPQHVQTWFTRFARAVGDQNAINQVGDNPFGWGYGSQSVPRCWGTLWLEAFNAGNDVITWHRLDPARNLPDNAWDMWPLQNLPPAYDAQTGQWSDGDPPPPFLSFPPCPHDLQIGFFVAVANRPATWLDPLTNTVHERPAEWIHDDRTAWQLRLDIRSACVSAKVRPDCMAWFAALETLDLSVPDAFPPQQGRYPVEPAQWRGLSFSLQRQQFDLTGVGDDHYRPEWTIARPYWRTAYVGTFADPAFTLGCTLEVFYVPCVALWLRVVPATGCPFLIKIYHDPHGSNVGPDHDNIAEPAGGVVIGTFVGAPWELDDPPWFYVGGWGIGLGQDQLFEPTVNPPSYNPVALAYRVACLDFYFGQSGLGSPTNKCSGANADPCHPDETHWSCSKTLLAAHGFTANYATTEVSAGVFRADQFWLWLELTAPAT